MCRNMRMMKTLAPHLCMPRTSQPAKTSSVICDDRVVGLVRVGLVVHREDNAGDRLHEERGQRRRAERLHPVDVVRHLAEEEPLDVSDEPGALLDPVDGDERDGLDLLAACGLGHGSGPRGRDRVQPRLPAVDRRAGVLVAVLLDLRVRAGARRPWRRCRACRARGCRSRSRTRTGRARAPAGPRRGCPPCRTTPPWQGQPKPETPAAGISVTSLYLLRLLVLERGPAGCTGQPRWAHRLKMHVEARRCRRP